MSEQLDWKDALAHLQATRQAYHDIGAAGGLALAFVLNPILARYERGERTPELHAAMLEVE